METRKGDLCALLAGMLALLERHAVFARGERVIVAVSGGGDSVALLHLLNRAKDSLGIALHVASLDHGIRGEAARQDLDFVGSLAEAWGMACTLGADDVPRRAKEWGVGIEEAARRARYRFLATVAREQGARAVAVGHHALDQAETLMMNIVRGSGLTGLRGMQVLSAMPGHPSLRLVRPLLHISKADLEAYCRRHDLPFRDDETNADIAYRRNFIRHEVMRPLLRLNPALLSAFARLSESAAIDEDFIAAQFESAVLPLVIATPARWRISKQDFAALHPALRRRLVQGAFRKLSGGAAALSHQTTIELADWALAASAGARRDMSAAIQMRRDYDWLCIERKDASPEYAQYRLIPAGSDRRIIADETLDLGDLKACLSTKPAAPEGGLFLAAPALLDLRLRTRRPGDRFKPRGMGGRSRKLKDWLIDRKVPRQIRDRIPLLCAGGEIIAIRLGDAWHLAESDCFGPGDAEAARLTLWRGAPTAK